MFYGHIFGLAKLVGAFKGLSPGEALISAGLMVLILPAMALSIALSSKALSMVEPISFAQFLTSLGISILFVALSFSVKLILEALKGVNPAVAIGCYTNTDTLRGIIICNCRVI
jgi:hypothetical protein